MAIRIDPPTWPARGRLWSHLISDRSTAELHEFAAAQGIPRRAFERDHYDVPADAYARLVEAGAVAVSSREVVRALVDGGLRRRKATSPAPRPPGHELLRPPALRSGDLVAVPACAGPVAADRLQAGIARLESWGLRVRVAEHALDVHPRLPYLSADDAVRAAEFTAAWLDPDVSAVLPARGGYGTQRMLDLLDWRRLAEVEPKVLVGFSDITALHQAVASRLGLVTIHSHVVTSLGAATSASATSLRLLLFEPNRVVDLFAGVPVETISGGRAEGVLVGGNVATLAAELATATSRPARGGIVVFEDVTEDCYRLDRLLTQLLRSGWFDGVKGIVLGRFTDCGDPAAVDAVLADRLLGLGVPVVGGFDLGHTPSTGSVPLGVRAVLDADAGSLTLDREPLIRR
jgi:muramoyltetrapeptide carboxypeptidase